MYWLYDLCGIQGLMDTDIPTEKIWEHLKTDKQKFKLIREDRNIQNIIYKKIFRTTLSGEELHIIEVELEVPCNVTPIADALNAAIPYEKLIVFSSKQKYLLYNGHYSDWVYEEELRACAESAEPEEELPGIEKDSAEYMVYRIEKLFYAAAGDRICLRHLVDLLKIKENRIEINSPLYERSIVSPILNALLDSDFLEYDADFYFVRKRDIIDRFNSVPYGSPIAGKCFYFDLEDDRYSFDRQFEMLAEEDFTTMDEMEGILQEARCYQPWCEEYFADEMEEENRKYFDLNAY